MELLNTVLFLTKVLILMLVTILIVNILYELNIFKKLTKFFHPFVNIIRVPSDIVLAISYRVVPFELLSSHRKTEPESEQLTGDEQLHQFVYR